MTTFDDLRSTPAFADHDDSLLDLSDDELQTVFIDLARRCCSALNESLSYGTSDSFVDDTNILTVMISTATNIAYRYDYTEHTYYDAFFKALNEGLLADLEALLDAGNSYDNTLITDATIWGHINITTED